MAFPNTHREHFFILLAAWVCSRAKDVLLFYSRNEIWSSPQTRLGSGPSPWFTVFIFSSNRLDRPKHCNHNRSITMLCFSGSNRWLVIGDTGGQSACLQKQAILSWLPISLEMSESAMIILRIKYLSPSGWCNQTCWLLVGGLLSQQGCGSAGLIVAAIDFQGKIWPTIDFAACSWCEKADLSDYGFPAGRGLFVSPADSNCLSVSLRSSWIAHNPILNLAVGSLNLNGKWWNNFLSSQLRYLVTITK